MRHLPPLNALRVFEVAARTGSYAEAAIELGVTHGAVSRQIAALEHWLGYVLFTRNGRRMAATPMALSFAREVGLAFDRLSAAAEACGRPGARRIVRVSAPTSFAMRWLLPRLPRFHEANPRIEVVVHTISTVLEVMRGGVDVTIRRGEVRQPAWAQYRVVPLLDESDTLIMSPALFRARPILTPADIAQHTLLGSETRPGDWSDWLRAAGLHRLPALRTQRFDHFFITRQAVEDGIGIGIGPLPLLGVDLASGRLMTPLPQISVPRTGYVAIVPHHADAATPSAMFVAWLRDEAALPAATEP